MSNDTYSSSTRIFKDLLDVAVVVANDLVEGLHGAQDAPGAKLLQHVHAAAVLGADIAGVDIILARDGTPMVLEVNSMPGWSGLQRVTPFSVAGRLAADFLVKSGLLAAAQG